MGVAWTWSGAQTDDGFTVTASLGTTSATSCTLVASVSADLSNPIESAAVDIDADGYCKMPITGLAADVRYHYGIKIDGIMDAWRGQARTLPTDGAAADFRVGFGSCSQTLSEAVVWSRIATRDPLMFIHLGDWGYFNISTDSPALFRAQYEAAMGCTARRNMMGAVALEYVWDNHDFGAAVDDGTSASKPAVSAVYRQIVPSYDLPAGDGADGDGNAPIYHDYRIGRIPFIVTDQRWNRTASGVDSPSSTMLGADQLAWFLGKLSEYKDAGAPVIFWCSEQVWFSDYTTSWGSYSTERNTIAKYIAENGIPPVVVLSGDAHAVSYQQGFSVVDGGAILTEHVSSAMDQIKGSEVEGTDWTVGPFNAYDYGGFYSILDLHDDGTNVWWTVTAWKAKSPTKADINLYTVDSRAPADAAALTEGVVRVYDGTRWVPHAIKSNSIGYPIYVRP